jgi:medium-chain acyl-[acyl-carrier-protein] hydrolase
MPISSDFKTVFSQEFEINHAQCTIDGTLKYVDLCTIFQLTCAKHSILGGIGIKEMQEHNQAWILNKMKIEIDELPKIEDKITVTSWIEEIGGKKSVRHMEMYKNGIQIAKAATLFVVVNTIERKIENVKLPTNHFETNQKQFIKETFQKIKSPEKLNQIKTRKVVLSDLDTVNHVNNTKYIEWCLDIFSPSMALKFKINKLEVHYKRELKWNDEAIIFNKIGEKSAYFKIKNEDESCFNMSINWDIKKAPISRSF